MVENLFLKIFVFFCCLLIICLGCFVKIFFWMLRKFFNVVCFLKVFFLIGVKVNLFDILKSGEVMFRICF